MLLAQPVRRWIYRCIAAAAVLVTLLACDERISMTQPSASQGTSASQDEPAWFVDVAGASGLVFEHETGATGAYLFPEIAGGGAALFDMDGDGDLDAFLVQSGSLTDPALARPGHRLFRNRGDGVFDDMTAGSGVDVPGYGMGATCGDFDNDGDIDLYITNVGPNVLLRNDGATSQGHRFTDVTEVAGVGDPGWSTGAAFVDYDGDGDLDLYSVNYVIWSVETDMPCIGTTGVRDYCGPKSYAAPAPDVLYRNNGDGTFTDVSLRAGLRAAYGNGLGIVCADYNADSRIDIFIANDGSKNQLWLNQGDGTFVDESDLWGCAMDRHGLAKAGMGVISSDMDDDGDFDLFVFNLANETDSFFRNEGSYFVDETNLVGLGVISRGFTRFGAGLIDFNNDGCRDLYVANGRVARQDSQYTDDPFAEPNLLFRGDRDGRFHELKPRGGTAQPLIATSRAAAFGDIDNDGGVDILVVNRDGPAHLLRNVAKDRGHWIMFRALDANGRDAFGAILTMTVNQRTLTHTVHAAYSYLASNDPRVHVGLGRHTHVRDVTVRWPDGTVQSFGDFNADQIVTLERRSESHAAAQP